MPVSPLRVRSLLLIVVTLAAAAPLRALELASVFGDHMVLQRGRPVPVWGTAAPGAVVQVSIGDLSTQGAADASGKFTVNLPGLPAGGPHTLTVRTVGASVTLDDVLVGEVWLCSGQSNMEWPLSRTDHAEAAIACADRPMIRLLHVPRTRAEQPQTEQGAAWVVCSPESVSGFSAVGYYFGVALHEALGVPVGLVGSSWGGTRIEAWMPADTLHEAGVEPAASPYEGMSLEARWQQYGDALSVWLDAIGRRGLPIAEEATGWAEPTFDDTAWETMTLPTAWQRAGLAFNGVVWFRRSVDVPTERAGQPATLALGAIDDLDDAWVNGRRVGDTTPQTPSFWSHRRVYDVPAGLLREGANTLAVRVRDHSGNGGMTGPANAMALRIGGTSLPLAGDWRYAVETRYPPMPAEAPAAPPAPIETPGPASLYHGMVHPLEPMSIRGAVWYQGESNAGQADRYAKLLTAMIHAWSQRFGHASPMPFGIVQLANFMQDGDDPDASPDWANLREAQRHVADTVPNATLAVAIDIGNPADIHPGNKRDVGKRLALTMLDEVYGHDVVPAGPTPGRISVEGNVLTVHYTHGEGLRSRHDDLARNFAIAGDNHAWHWADATIVNDTVQLTAEGVPNPTRVRYGWQNNPRASLENEAGLPAVPFAMSLDATE